VACIIGNHGYQKSKIIKMRKRQK